MTTTQRPTGSDANATAFRPKCSATRSFAAYRGERPDRRAGLPRRTLAAGLVVIGGAALPRCGDAALADLKVVVAKDHVCLASKVPTQRTSFTIPGAGRMQITYAQSKRRAYAPWGGPDFVFPGSAGKGYPGRHISRTDEPLTPVEGMPYKIVWIRQCDESHKGMRVDVALGALGYPAGGQPPGAHVYAQVTRLKVEWLGTGSTADPQPKPDEDQPVFSNNNSQIVRNGPTAPTTFTIKQALLVTYAMTYHWNAGQGKTPGTIALLHADGTVYGPWQTGGRKVNGKAHNAYWECTPGVVLKPGAYTVIDSDPATWSQNGASGGQGIFEIKGGPVPPPGQACWVRLKAERHQYQVPKDPGARPAFAVEWRGTQRSMVSSLQGKIGYTKEIQKQLAHWSWTGPPRVLAPGQKLKMSVLIDLRQNAPRDRGYHWGGAAGARFQRPGWPFGTRSDPQFHNAKGKPSDGFVRATPPGKIRFDGQAEVPGGGWPGVLDVGGRKQMALQIGLSHGGQWVAFEYIYVWWPATSPPAEPATPR